ncbi:MAG: hypothetical protein [CRESS virus sp. ctxk12]|nr:MAG: hypothetical protein [CRESS virus sp. ctxk12]
MPLPFFTAAGVAAAGIASYLGIGTEGREALGKGLGQLSSAADLALDVAELYPGAPWFSQGARYVRDYISGVHGMHRKVQGMLGDRDVHPVQVPGYSERVPYDSYKLDSWGIPRHQTYWVREHPSFFRPYVGRRSQLSYNKTRAPRVGYWRPPLSAPRRSIMPRRFRRRFTRPRFRRRFRRRYGGYRRRRSFGVKRRRFVYRRARRLIASMRPKRADVQVGHKSVAANALTNQASPTFGASGNVLYISPMRMPARPGGQYDIGGTKYPLRTAANQMQGRKIRLHRLKFKFEFWYDQSVMYGLDYSGGAPTPAFSSFHVWFGLFRKNIGSVANAYAQFGLYSDSLNSSDKPYIFYRRNHDTLNTLGDFSVGQQWHQREVRYWLRHPRFLKYFKLLGHKHYRVGPEQNIWARTSAGTNVYEPIRKDVAPVLGAAAGQFTFRSRKGLVMERDQDSVGVTPAALVDGALPLYAGQCDAFQCVYGAVPFMVIYCEDTSGLTAEANWTLNSTYAISWNE